MIVDVESILKPILFDKSEATKYHRMARDNVANSLNDIDRAKAERLEEYWLGKYIALSMAEAIIEREAGMR